MNVMNLHFIKIHSAGRGNETEVYNVVFNYEQ